MRFHFYHSLHTRRYSATMVHTTIKARRAKSLWGPILSKNSYKNVLRRRRKPKASTRCINHSNTCMHPSVCNAHARLVCKCSEVILYRFYLDASVAWNNLWADGLLVGIPSFGCVRVERFKAAFLEVISVSLCILYGFHCVRVTLEISCSLLSQANTFSLMYVYWSHLYVD